MELILNTNLETAIPAVIDFNHEQLKAELAEKLVKYNGLVVTEDSIKLAKSDRAGLNKLRSAFDDRRKDVKKACLKPYEDFERKTKEIIAMIDQPITAIDTQLKAFDEIKKEEKRNSIEKFYSDNIGDLRELLPINKLWSGKWLNSTVTLLSVTQEIMDTIAKFRNDYNILKAMRLECKQQVLDTYVHTLDMSAALAEKTRFEDQQKRIAEYEQQKAKQPDVDCGVVPPTEVEPITQTYLYNAPAASLETEETKDIKVVFYGTTAAFRSDMKALTEKHNIRYGGLK